jgi:hypothetical protein
MLLLQLERWDAEVSFLILLDLRLRLPRVVVRILAMSVDEAKGLRSSDGLVLQVTPPCAPSKANLVGLGGPHHLCLDPL